MAALEPNARSLIITYNLQKPNGELHDHLVQQGRHVFLVSPSDLGGLRQSLEDARSTLNRTLTVWKDSVGDQEKFAERRAETLKIAARAIKEGEGESEEEE